MSKTAVILFNLGGPDSLKAIKPFLFNLFNDKYVINLPQPLRYFLAKYISIKRTPYTTKIYEKLGGSSPILKETENQTAALQKKLGDNYRVFTSMRHWKPFIEETVQQVKEYNPEDIILLPLYPQFSIATTLSFAEAIWNKLPSTPKLICCYHSHPLFIKAHVDSILPYYYEAAAFGSPIILFSAHGLPKKLIEQGDPYQWQIENTVNSIINSLNINVAWSICYQSKVGKAEWLSPDTKEEIEKYKNRPIVLVPIAFVSEHSETLVELDIEYKALAPHYYRVPTLRTDPTFIACLADLCKSQTNRCPAQFKRCPYNFPCKSTSITTPSSLLS